MKYESTKSLKINEMKKNKIKKSLKNREFAVKMPPTRQSKGWRLWLRLLDAP